MRETSEASDPHDPHRELPSALERVDEILRRASGRRLAVFLDFDGTLAPIVERPELATLDDATRQAVARLARACPVAVVSGRDRADVAARVGLEGIAYAGSHGFDISLPDGTRHDHPAGAERLAALDRAEASLRAALADVPGALVERKRFSIAAHSRLVPDALVPRVEAAVDAALEPGLRKKTGKKVLELQPDVPWDKGAAVRWLLEALHLAPDAFPIYVGDDVTDEDAFRAVRDDGLGVAVLDAPRPTAATLALRDPGEVRELLERIVAAREHGNVQ